MLQDDDRQSNCSHWLYKLNLVLTKEGIMKTRQNTELRSIRFLIALTLTLMVLGSAPVTLGGFPEFTPTAGAPEGVVVDGAGNVFVSVRGATSDQIWKFSPTGVGTLLSDLGEPAGGANGLAVDDAGNVYMCRFTVNPATAAGTPCWRITAPSLRD